MAEYNMPQYILREFKVTDARVRASITCRNLPEEGYLCLFFHMNVTQDGIEGTAGVCEQSVAGGGCFTQTRRSHILRLALDFRAFWRL